MLESVDTTGAADAFAATLAVYLSRGEALETAVGIRQLRRPGYPLRGRACRPRWLTGTTIELYMSKRNAQTNGRINVMSNTFFAPVDEIALLRRLQRPNAPVDVVLDTDYF